MRLIFRLTVACWIGFVTWSVLFSWFWWIDHTWPHGAWAVASLGSAAALLIWLLIACLIQTAKNWWGNRGRALQCFGCFLIGAAPLASFGAFWLEATFQFGDRRAVQINQVHRVARTWLMSYFDLVSRPGRSRSPGRHVVLIHPSDLKAAQRLVQEMDDVVEEFSQTLGCDPPRRRVAWVRGKLSGQSGLSVGPWAITDDNQDPNAVTELDRHEVAHAVISELSPRDHEPPKLFVEGWAQSQSTPRDALIEGLHVDYDGRRHLYLDELVDEPFYSASKWQTYHYGGPLVLFLIEHYSGQAFLELYRDVRMPTFRGDVERILGEPWSSVESRFWDWLDEEARELDERDQTKSDWQLEFADPKDRPEWKRLCERYSQMDWTLPPLPTGGTIGVDAEINDGDEPEPFTRRIQAVYEPGRIWWAYWMKGRLREVILLNDHHWAHVEQHNDGVLTGISGGDGNRGEVRSIATIKTHHFQNLHEADPAGVLPLERPLPGVPRMRIDQVDPPNDGSPVWNVRYTEWRAVGQNPDDGSDEEPVERRGEISMDPENRLAVVRHSHGASDEQRSSMEAEYRLVGELLVPHRLGTTYRADDYNVSAEVSARELTHQEVESLKRTVENLAGKIDTRTKSRWYEYVPPAAQAMLPLGILCVLVSCVLVGRREKATAAD